MDLVFCYWFHGLVQHVNLCAIVFYNHVMLDMLLYHFLSSPSVAKLFNSSVFSSGSKGKKLVFMIIRGIFYMLMVCTSSILQSTVIKSTM